jgi:tRNA threonylcarbamoyladenosine biosynthesis protein TsaB
MEMAIILSIETSGKVCSVALSTANTFYGTLNYELIAEYSINIGNKHDKFCAELCNRIIKDNEYNVSNIDAVAVSIGPGSFTGLRIGISITKGLCFDLEKEIPILAVPTLTALANNAVDIANICKDDTKILAIIPSHNNLVYHQLFNKNGEKNSDIEFSDLDLLSQKYSNNNNLVIATNIPIKINFGNYIPTLSYISASSIAKLATKMYSNNEFTNSIDIQPLYIQNFIPR